MCVDHKHSFLPLSYSFQIPSSPTSSPPSLIPSVFALFVFKKKKSPARICMDVGCPQQQEQLPWATPLKKTHSAPGNHHVPAAPRIGVGPPAPFSSPPWDWQDRARSSHHSYCEFMDSKPCPEDAISQQPCLYSGSYNLSTLTKHSETVRREGSCKRQPIVTVENFLNRTPFTQELISTTDRWKERVCVQQRKQATEWRGSPKWEKSLTSCRSSRWWISRFSPRLSH